MDGQDLFFWSSSVRWPAAMSTAQAAASGGVPVVQCGSEVADEVRRRSVNLVVFPMSVLPFFCGGCGRTDAVNN
jgi:hypothetical protein